MASRSCAITARSPDHIPLQSGPRWRNSVACRRARSRAAGAASFSRSKRQKTPHMGRDDSTRRADESVFRPDDLVAALGLRAPVATPVALAARLLGHLGAEVPA